MIVGTINEVLNNAVKKYGKNIALKFEEKTLTYKELDILANKKANYLIHKGVKKEDFIGIICEHNLDLIVNILAVIKSGAAYIPMEPTFPKERINYIIEQAPIKFVITQSKYFDIIKNKNIIIHNDIDISKYSELSPQNVNCENNALYVLYTSGTTGTPKGVVVEHRNVVNYICAFEKEFNISEQDKMLQNSVVTFDIFTEELFPVLANGGTLVIVPQDYVNDAKKIMNFIDKEKISFMSSFPYLISDINKLVGEGVKFPKSLRVIISGGDTLRKEHCNNLINRTSVYNTYGPTETTVACSYYHYTDENVDSKTVPIGTSIYGTKMIVLDDKFNKVKQGDIGQICILGNGVSRGYLNKPEETAENFVENPFKQGERMYLSGDLGVLKEDGNIEFVKRKDEQVMIRGKRVEPLEVENVLYKLKEIDIAVVKPYQDNEGYSYLVGYVKISNNNITINSLKKHLLQYVPDFMVPEFWVKINEFGKTLNGKIDRKILPVVLK